MRASAILLVCLLAALAGSAQQNTLLPPAQFHPRSTVSGASCPVSLRVGQRGLVYLYNAEQQISPPAKIPAQSIAINLINLQAKDIVAVDALVQGIPGFPHFSLMPLRPEGRTITTKQPEGATKQVYGTRENLPPPVSFHAGLHMSPQGNATLEWTLENAGGVQWVEIDRIVYADGSEWLRSQSDSCKVAPDPMVLVK